jgi:putative multiple sugar transport system substrate-binding protein
MRRKLLIAATTAAIAAIALAGCSTGRSGGSSDDAGIKKGDTVGVALPQKTSANWVLAKQSFEDALKKAGFKADVIYTSDSGGVPDQQRTVANMVTKGYKAIIIAAQDGSQLGTQTAAAKKAGATVIAWDRNITGTENVDYYVAFNNFKVGQLQAQALLAGMQAKKASGPYNIELFAGASTDANAQVFFNGAMDVLQPKIDDGTLKVVSGQTSFQQVQTDNWDKGNAQKRMSNLITAHYSDGTVLDGVLSPNDQLALGILTATKAANLENPVVTGQDSELDAITRIMQGTQYSTIYKNTDEEAQAAVDLVSDLAAGKTPSNLVTDDKTNSGNGKKTVPYIPLTPILITKENAVKEYASNPEMEAAAKKG